MKERLQEHQEKPSHISAMRHRLVSDAPPELLEGSTMSNIETVTFGLLLASPPSFIFFFVFFVHYY